MKKIMIAAFAVAFAAVAQAASVDWKLTATAAEEGYTVLLFSSEVAASYDSYQALVDSALDSSVVIAKSVKGGKSYTATSTANDTTIPNALFAVIISGESASEFKFGAVSADGLIYDPGAQQSSPGYINLTNASFTSTGTIGGGESIPEPTSALMLLVGLAGLALKRKVA